MTTRAIIGECVFNGVAAVALTAGAVFNTGVVPCTLIVMTAMFIGLGTGVRVIRAE